MKKLFKIIFFIVIILLLAFIFYPRNNMLVVTLTASQKPVYYFQLDENEEFILSFTHSINKRPVYEYIKNHDGQLMVYKARYDAFGAGMPETSSGNLKVSMLEDGVIELTGIDRAMDEFSVFVGTVANHAITEGGREIPLNTIAKPGESLTFKLTDTTYFTLWKEKLLNE